MSSAASVGTGAGASASAVAGAGGAPPPPSSSSYSASAFGGSVRDLELLYVFSTESNIEATINLPQTIIAIIAEFADESEPDAGSVASYTTPTNGDGIWFESLESALLHDRPDMVPQSVASRMYFARQSSATAQALAARLTWDEKIEFSYSPEWNKRDETPVYCRIIERAGAWRQRQGEFTPQSQFLRATPPVLVAKTGSGTVLPASSSGVMPPVPATLLACDGKPLHQPPNAMPIAADLLDMVNGTSKRLFRRSPIDQFPLYTILVPEAPAAAATAASTAAGAAASPAPAPSGAWCVYLNSMYCPSTIPWSRSLLKQKGFKMVGYWIPSQWSTPEWRETIQHTADSSGKKQKRGGGGGDDDDDGGGGDSEDEYDIHEQINDPSTLDIPNSAKHAAAGVNTEVLFTIRDCWDVDRHLPLLESLEACLKKYLREAFELEYTGDSDELEVVFHYPVQPIFELLHFQLHYKSSGATYRHSTSHRLSHVIEALRKRRDTRLYELSVAAAGKPGALTHRQQSWDGKTNVTPRAASVSIGSDNRTPGSGTAASTTSSSGALASARGGTLKTALVVKPAPTSIFIPSYLLTHSLSTSNVTEWTMFNSAQAAIHPPHCRVTGAAAAAAATATATAAAGTTAPAPVAAATAPASNQPVAFTFPHAATAAPAAATAALVTPPSIVERERCLEYRALARHMIFHPFYGCRVKRIRAFEYVVGY